MDKTFCKRCGCEIWTDLAIESSYCDGCWTADSFIRDMARTARVDKANEKERLREAIGKDVCGCYLTHREDIRG